MIVATLIVVQNSHCGIDNDDRNIVTIDHAINYSLFKRYGKILELK